MKAIKPSVEILDTINAETVYKKLELIGRVCYKSEANISDGSSEKFLKSIIQRGHESVIEHEKVSIKIICDRGVTHEIVRHRIASYSQESTRYCNYSFDKFGNEITFIKPCYWEEGSKEYTIWEKQMKDVEAVYFDLLEQGAKPEEARAVLPNSLKTEIVMTMNIRELRHFIKLRTSKASHPQMREVANILLDKLNECLPVLFGDLK